MDGGADLVDMGSVGADELVELVAGDAELFGPVGNVRGHFGVDLFGVVRAFCGVVFVGGVRLVAFGGVVVLGHGVLPLFRSPGWMRKRRVGMHPESVTD
jgi:hypothetical protein